MQRPSLFSRRLLSCGSLSRGLVLGSLLSLVLGCGGGAGDGGASGSKGGPAAARSGPIKVVATTGMIGDTAARIAGEYAETIALMGPGVDPHLFKASESDVRKLSNADLILYNGLHLEGKMGDILVKLARQRPVVAVSETIPDDQLREPPEFLGQYDPHVWFDVSLWLQTLGPIADAMTELDPAHEADFRRNAEELRVELTALDLWVAERIAEIPRERRILVTAHDAFGYFGRRYDIDVIGIQGISTLAEAGLQDMERVVDLVVDRGVKAIFVE
ncbi:MAG: zinc ABC transporter substrate-binding protein, partial [Thermoanaerobaculia bacterium]|nr:zinc ABC transporter substrate-binding protein [Thermoanaerobaculia bacterium]